MLEHETWLLWAENDLIIASILINHPEVTVSGVFYHCQQCIEKALKAYLSFKKQAKPKTHDLIKLMRLCTQFDEAFFTLNSISLDLDPPYKLQPLS
jgi:HEPN domain-containing protein